MNAGALHQRADLRTIEAAARADLTARGMTTNDAPDAGTQRAEYYTEDGVFELANNVAQPVRHGGITHVLGTQCYPCLRVGPPIGLVAADGFEPPTKGL